ncbi:hypothetical protein A2215_00285 [Candidatus Berkelbacteria bacterium RIFOXYA2_FULL_43_10]|uniref:Uncharacterized protein n=1 Tax=Candidatus Berkelbacteria bacterium RIFOXYA2_FULL_43_10 TaxID=1797472 RepID=A0A1F5E6I8_9BACT|nr:MAG: hypothetical protein A2215_00285 [Candidatus Berkelbacteria bacterium RIFOXYA2_FULL_43_10]
MKELSEEHANKLLSKIAHDPHPMLLIIYLVLWFRSDGRERVCAGPDLLDTLGSLPLNIICFGFKDALSEALTLAQMSKLDQGLLGRIEFDQCQRDSILRWPTTELRKRLEAIKGSSPHRVKVTRIAEILTDLAGAETK